MFIAYSLETQLIRNIPGENHHLEEQHKCDYHYYIIKFISAGSNMYSGA